MKKDKLFLKQSTTTDFDFGEKTAEVFDDMLDRSVPLYRELQRMTGELANEFAADGTQVYDLRCSTGTTLHTLCESIEKDVTFIGIDNSEAMLKKAEENFKKACISAKYQFILEDLNERLDIQNASVVVLNLTLQFVRPLYREILIRTIYSGLNKNGCLILVEKVLGNDSLFNRQFIKFYYDMKKRHGYSEMEIAQKREALENVLIPYRVDENIELLNKQGFSHVEIFFKWYNFCGFIAVK